MSSASTKLASLLSVPAICVSSGNFSENLTQNSHGNNFLKQSHNLIVDLYTKRGRGLGRNAGIRSGK